MKKLVTLLIALTMLLSMATPALAEPYRRDLDLPESDYALPDVTYLSELEQELVDLVDVDYAIEVLDRIPLRRTPGSWGNAEARKVFLEEYEKWYPGQAFVVSYPMHNGNPTANGQNPDPKLASVAMDDGWIKIGDTKYVYYGQGPNSGSPGPYTITNGDPYGGYTTVYKFRGVDASQNSQVKNTTGVEFIEWAPTTWTGTGTATFPELTIPDGLNVAGKTVVVLNTAAKNTPNASTSTGSSPNASQGSMTAQPSGANFYNAALTLQNANAAAVVFSTAQTADKYWHTLRQYWVPEGDSGFYRIPNTTSGTAITIPVGLVTYKDTNEEFARIRALSQAERDALQMEIAMETNTTLNTVMCLKPAADPNEKRTVWIGGHFDSHLYGSRNDNGSGTAMMLAIAKAFKDIPTKFNIMFVNWDWEESGYGSSYFCRQLMTEEQKDNFVAYLNLDMAATSASINDLLMFSGPGYRVDPAGTNNNIPRGGGLEGNVTAGGSYLGATGTLVKGEYPLDFVGGRKVAEEFTTVYNILNNFVYTSKKLGLSEHDISISNGGSSDHAQFYNQRAVVNGVVTRPNLLNSMHMDWRPKVKPHPSGTDGLEIHWHKEGDDWENIDRNKYKVSGDSLSLMLAGAAGAEGFALPGALSFNVTADKEALTGGDAYFTMTAYFENLINTNAFTLNFKYDKELFAFRNANIEANKTNYGLDIINAEETEDGYKLTVAKLGGYGVTSLGDFLFSTVGDVAAANSSSIEVTVDYVNKGDTEKLVLTSFDVLNFVTTVTGPFTLLDLSDLIDWFGVTSSDPEWAEAKYWNFNGNNEIDINDIVYVAQNIE